MADVKHTPGPWAVDKSRIDFNEVVVYWAGDSGPGTVEIAHIKQIPPTGDAVPDADMIAAAPDQNAVLERVDKWLDEEAEGGFIEDNADSVHDAVKAVLRQARGEN